MIPLDPLQTPAVVFGMMGPVLVSGAIFYDLHRDRPAVLDVYSASVLDGMGKVAHKRLFIIETGENGNHTIRQPTVFLDIIPAPADAMVPCWTLPTHEEVKMFPMRRGSLIFSMRSRRSGSARLPPSPGISPSVWTS